MSRRPHARIRGTNFRARGLLYTWYRPGMPAKRIRLPGGAIRGAR